MTNSHPRFFFPAVGSSGAIVTAPSTKRRRMMNSY